jgi:hypothetical protein
MLRPCELVGRIGSISRLFSAADSVESVEACCYRDVDGRLNATMQTEPYPARRPGDVDIGKGLRSADLTVASFQVNHDPVRPAVDRRFDYRGRSEVISGIATVSPGLIDAATGGDLLLQDSLSLPIVNSIEEASACSRMEKLFFGIQDCHAHTSELSAL